MSASPNERMAAKVAAVNKAHQAALEIYHLMRPIFEPFIGEKIDKQDGTFLAKIAKLLPPLSYEHDLRVIRNSSNYSLSWTIYTSEECGDTGNHVSYEVTVYVGGMSGGRLVDLKYDAPVDRRRDFTVEWLREARAQCRRKKEAYEAAQRALWPFDEDYDR